MGKKGEHSEIMPNIFQSSVSLCDAIDDCNLYGSHTVEFPTWLKFFTEIVLKNSMRTGDCFYFIGLEN